MVNPAADQSLPPPPSHATVETNALTEDDIIIAVMGATGVGKSSFISMAIGGDYETIGHGLESHTQNVRAVRYRHPSDLSRTYVFLDTPGFDDTYLSDTDILITISNWLTVTYKRKMLLTGILFLHRISDNRMSGSALRNTDMFQMLCGDSGLPNIVLVTTMWDQVTKEAGEMREKELRDTFWQPMIDKHSRTARFRHTTESAWEVLSQFTKEHRPIKLKIQTQMVDEGIPLSKTAAGSFLGLWLIVLSKQFKSMAGWFKTKLREPRRSPVYVAELKREKASAEEKVRLVKVQQARLEAQSMHSNRSLRSRRSWDGSFISDSSMSPLVTAPTSPISPPTPSSSRHRASEAIRAVFKPSQERRQTIPQIGTAQKESEMWGKYGTITFPTNGYLHTRNKQTTSPTMTGTPTSYTGTSPYRNRYDSHTSGQRHDSIPPLQPIDTETRESTLDASIPLAVLLLSNVHSLAFEVANFIDDIAVPSELAAIVAEESRKLTAASQSQGYSGPIEVVQSLYRDLYDLRQILISQQAGEIDQETFNRPFLACQKSLKKFSKSVPRPSTTSNKRWQYHDMDVQQDLP
ncbi:hypothetical protein FIBSPDRAFT_944598 [Athelia psychrophila]|uniref:Uncharacterized protein n=1 Tax=Athelia psychrophila TaxID=1759441 RepID=A0A166UTG1_9AGAM|nr:hypothetical protein FIBSPDRAFT_944598 [Fibularhizoctonia sp. CBS 109695]